MNWLSTLKWEQKLGDKSFTINYSYDHYLKLVLTMVAIIEWLELSKQIFWLNKAKVLCTISLDNPMTFIALNTKLRIRAETLRGLLGRITKIVWDDANTQRFMSILKPNNSQPTTLICVLMRHSDLHVHQYRDGNC